MQKDHINTVIFEFIMVYNLHFRSNPHLKMAASAPSLNDLNTSHMDHSGHSSDYCSHVLEDDSGMDCIHLQPLCDVNICEGSDKKVLLIVSKLNCISMYFYALQHGINTTVTKAKHAIITFFSSIVYFEEFVELPLQKLYEILAIIKDQDEEQQDSLLKACLVWLDYDIENRKYLFPKLINQIYLIKCSSAYLMQVSKSHEYLWPMCD